MAEEIFRNGLKATRMVVNMEMLSSWTNMNYTVNYEVHCEDPTLYHVTYVLWYYTILSVEWSKFVDETKSFIELNPLLCFLFMTLHFLTCTQTKWNNGHVLYYNVNVLNMYI